MKLTQADFQQRRDLLAKKWAAIALQLLRRVQKCIVIAMRIINIVQTVVFISDWFCRA
jgi:hypothetical protein